MRVKYFVNLTAGRTALWCYFLWYSFFAVCYFDPSRNLWLTSLGLGLVVGIALMIITSTTTVLSGAAFRLFAIPFCVASFSALVKGKGFLLIFSPRMQENYLAFGLCAAFGGFVAGVKMARR